MSRSHGRPASIVLVLCSITSVQFGAALAATLFPLVGPVAVVALRSVAAVAALVVARNVSRPPGSGAPDQRPAGLRVPVTLGVVLAVMNTCVYEAVARLPLGAVITLEFLGPLGVALAYSRRRRDVVLALTAGAGVTLLSAPTGADGHGLDPLGVALALAGALGWALYILLTRELGRHGGSHGLVVACTVAAALVTPVAVAGSGTALLQPKVLVIGAVVGLLSSALPFSLDRLALRRLPAGAFGVLMSVNPAVATLAGLLVLDQSPAPAQLAGTALVVAASATSTLGSP